MKRRFHKFWHNYKHLVYAIGTVSIILITAAIIIALGRGYRVDLRKNNVRPTGLISVSSNPTGAEVYVNDELKTATNNSFAIDPGWYKIKISRESYISWEKTIRVQGEVVSQADAYLFPANASLSPLTTSGVLHPTLSPDGNKIAYIIPESAGSEKMGVWVFELSENALGRNRDPIHIHTLNADTATITWSPDATQLLLEMPNAITHLYQASRTNIPTLINSIQAQNLRTEWTTLHNQKIITQLASLKQPIIDIATSSASIIAFSPDESKMLYEATASAILPEVIVPPLIGTNTTKQERTIIPGNIYVYDIKEDRNYFLMKTNELPTASPTPSKKSGRTPTPTPLPIPQSTYPMMWFPTSRHMLLIYPEKIDVMEFDRTNWITLYSGPFVSSFVTPWPNGSRIIILTTLNAKEATIPNLYTINLR